jgi:hypothetical protein
MKWLDVIITRKKVKKMKFSVIKNGINVSGLKISEQLIQTFINHGHYLTEDTNDIRFVLNLTNIEKPQIFRRSSFCHR